MVLAINFIVPPIYKNLEDLAKNIPAYSNEIYNFIVNQLITRTEFLFRVGRKDDDTLATDYFCLQPNTEEECEECLNDYGMTKHSYINYSILSKRNNGTSVSLNFLKRYFT